MDAAGTLSLSHFQSGNGCARGACVARVSHLRGISGGRRVSRKRAHAANSSSSRFNRANQDRRIQRRC